MQYHIETTPIWDAFKLGCDCPLCVIYNTCSERLVSQYLNEAVMEPVYRVRVNKLGFCSTHLKNLYNGENKLGLALQLNTRTDYVLDKMNEVKNLKQAKKESEHLKKTLSTCVICESADEMMVRYALTIAQMYYNEREFPALFKSSKGFCMPHYILLLENAHGAKSKVNEYLSQLSYFQKSCLEKTNNDTQRFADSFDYKNKLKGEKGSPQAVPNAINKLSGKII